MAQNEQRPGYAANDPDQKPRPGQTQDDITDSPSDQERLKPDEAILDLPDVRDIPGQEHVHPPGLGELADVTISSADEEGILNGDDLSDESDDADIVMGTEADVSAGEAALLQRADEDMPTRDDNRLREATLDQTDEDGAPLNENSTDVSGADLDTALVDVDDAHEAIGEEDEENNPYSLGSDDNDENENRTDSL